MNKKEYKHYIYFEEWCQEASSDAFVAGHQAVARRFCKSVLLHNCRNNSEEFFIIIVFSSTVSSLHTRVDSLEKSNTKLIEEVWSFSNICFSVETGNLCLRLGFGFYFGLGFIYFFWFVSAKTFPLAKRCIVCYTELLSSMGMAASAQLQLTMKSWSICTKQLFLPYKAGISARLAKMLRWS